MKVINPIVTIEEVDGLKIVKNIERYGRICYKSLSKITDDSYKSFISNVIKRGHLSVIEHEKVTAVIVCDRGVTHEIVRHRIGSYSQESTRYINYKEGLTVVRPFFWPEEYRNYNIWYSQMLSAEKAYQELIESGAKPEEARTVLPNSLATEIAITYNMREWRHFFELRGSKGAHPQIREIAVDILEIMKQDIPIIFDDLIIDKDKRLITSNLK